MRTADEIGQLAQSFNRMSADLAHSTQLRKQMTADIAHDLRTPLSVILGYSEALGITLEQLQAARRTAMAVSYTHLDVYKRQSVACGRACRASATTSR